MAEPLARHLVPADGIEAPLPEAPPQQDTGARLAIGLLAYMAAITTVITLLPFRFAVPTQLRIVVIGGLFDLVANLALFVPLGFLYAVARKDAATRPGRVFVVALIASAAVESVQLFEVSRYASLADILANGAGAYLGAIGQVRLSRRIAMDARTVGRLSLELPVMGLVYLLIPLLWVDGIAGARAVRRQPAGGGATTSFRAQPPPVA